MVVVTVLPLAPSTRSLGVSTSRSPSLTYSTSGSIGVSTTLSFAATLTIVSVGFTTTGSPTLSVIAPVVESTLYVVVVVLEPACPASSTFGWSLSRVSSFTYFLGDGIAVVSTLSFAATLTIVLVGSFVRTG